MEGVWLLLQLLLLGFAISFETEENLDVDLHEGDIILTPSQKLSLDVFRDPTAAIPSVGRGAMKDPMKLWTSHILPYDITSDLEAYPEAREVIGTAMKEWEENSCLKFVRRTNETDYIEFFMGKGCYSYVGRRGGKQRISLKNTCWKTGTVVHEIGHALGFWHEQSRPDRDNFVEILWENIPERKKKNFRGYNRTKIDSLGVPYDYNSVMHYSSTAFGRGKITIRSKDPTVIQLGQRIGLSPKDVKQADLLYRCNGLTTQTAIKTTKPPPPNGPDDCAFEEITKCGWHNVHGTDDQFDWTQRMGRTGTSYTGPATDHTTGKFGFFMYIETSWPRKPGDIAILDSRNFFARNPRRFNFYYHMYGEDIGTLSVKLNRGTSSNQRHYSYVYSDIYVTCGVFTLWSSSGNQGNSWKLASVNIPASINPFKLSFVGVRGLGFYGDAAIDDVFFTEGLC